MVKNCVLGGLLCVAAAGFGANMNTGKFARAVSSA